MYTCLVLFSVLLSLLVSGSGFPTFLFILFPFSLLGGCNGLGPYGDFLRKHAGPWKSLGMCRDPDTFPKGPGEARGCDLETFRWAGQGLLPHMVLRLEVR